MYPRAPHATQPSTGPHRVQTQIVALCVSVCVCGAQVKCKATCGQDLLDPEVQLEAFNCRAAAMLALASQV